MVAELSISDTSLLLRNSYGGPEKDRFNCSFFRRRWDSLTSETVQGSALSLQRVDDVHSCDSFPFRMLGVGDSVTNNIFEEDFQYTSGFFVDQSGNTFHSTTSGQTTNCGLGDTLDVITKNFTMTLGTTFAKTFTAFTSSGYIERLTA